MLLDACGADWSRMDVTSPCKLLPLASSSSRAQTPPHRPPRSLSAAPAPSTATEQLLIRTSPGQEASPAAAAPPAATANAFTARIGGIQALGRRHPGSSRLPPEPTALGTPRRREAGADAA